MLAAFTFYSSLHWCRLLFCSLEHRKGDLRDEVMEGARVCVLCSAWSGYTGSSREKCHCYQQENIKTPVSLKKNWAQFLKGQPQRYVERTCILC